MKKSILVLFLILITLIIASQQSSAQIAIRHQVTPSIKADSLDMAYYSRKNPWLAGSKVFGINMLIWGFDRYIQKADFAYIDWGTIKTNFKRGFVWDNDQMGTNMFLHPYHGSLYYNSARSNGYNYWVSGLYAFGGSAMWELFLENEYPSMNDIIATPIGGMALGEVFYRASDLILDDRATGNARFGREAAAFIVSPMRGLTRIINGDAWRKRPTSGRQFGIPDISVEVSAGARALEFRDEVFDKGVGAAISLNLEYGDRFDTENKRPYDYFSFNTDLAIQASQPLLSQLNIVGRLYAAELIDNSKDFLSIGAYQHFDYYDSDTISDISHKTPYKFCTPASVGVGLMYKSKRSNKLNFDAYSHLNLILLGGALSDHYVVSERNYNLASGFSWKAGANLAWKDKFSASFTYNAYRMFTWRGYPEDIDWNSIDPHEIDYQGDESQAILHAISLRLDLKLRKQLYLTGVGSNYTRDTNYKYKPNVFSNTSEAKLMLTYKF